MKNRISKGDIYYIKQDKNNTPTGSEMWANRPAIIVSNNKNNKYAPTVGVVFLTSNLNKDLTPNHIKIIDGDRASIALCEQIHTIDKKRLGRRLGKISKKELNEINKALMFILSLQ